MKKAIILYVSILCFLVICPVAFAESGQEHTYGDDAYSNEPIVFLRALPCWCGNPLYPTGDEYVLRSRTNIYYRCPNGYSYELHDCYEYRDDVYQDMTCSDGHDISVLVRKGPVVKLECEHD